jgi:hypothetical protein
MTDDFRKNSQASSQALGLGMGWECASAKPKVFTFQQQMALSVSQTLKQTAEREASIP